MTFTINNKTAGSLTYLSSTITAGNSLAINEPVFVYAEDIVLRSDIMRGNASITVGTDEFAFTSAITLLDVIARRNNDSEVIARIGQMFSAAYPSSALTGTTETPLIYINNPNGSGKSLKLYLLNFGPTLGNNYATYRVYRDGTVTANGTALTVTGARNVGNATTVVSAFHTPTTSSNGTLLKTFVTSGLSGQSIEWSVDFSQILDPNHNYIITRQLSANATIGGVNIEWAEQ